MSSRKRKPKRKLKPKPKRRRSDFTDVTSTLGSSGALSSQKRERSDFADGALTSGSFLMSSSRKQKRSDFADDALTSGYKYDVFLSFRGPDTRSTVADVLYEILVSAGFKVFRDNEELQVGKNIGRELERAIDDSRIYVPIFSEGFASSPWCLQELARMVKCRRGSAGHEIVPVFFGASPSDVRLKRGPYGDDLLGHKGCYGEERVREWREALREVADLKGWDARNLGLGKLANNLVRELSIKLKKRQMVLPNYLVGIGDRVRDVMLLLDCGSLDVRFLVVHGMGGIGKTTLAKAVFNEIFPLFDGCTFLSDFGEYSTGNGIRNVQKQLLSDIMNYHSTVFNDVDNLQDRIRNKRVLIVLDNVNEKQLMELIGKWDWLGPGSRVICTTRNWGVLADVPFRPKEYFEKQLMELIGNWDWLGQGSRVICRTRNWGVLADVPFRPKEYFDYEMTEMNPWHALQLFSKHAFGQTLPPDEFEALSSEIVATARGLPLALEILGSLLSGKSIEFWRETLERLREAPDLTKKKKKKREAPDRRVQKMLKVSYEALSFGEKQICLDVACFFIGKESTSAIYMWKECGYFPENGLAALTDGSLWKIDHDSILRMHDLIRNLGREIVQKENYLHAGSRSRLWESEECLRVLREPVNYQRMSNVETLRLQLPEVQSLTSQEFAALPKLRVLEAEGVHFTGDYKNVFRELRWLSLKRCPADFDAVNFSPSNLVVLKLSDSELRDDWPGWHQITKSSKLKFLELARCSRLTRLPNLSHLSTLERLIIRNGESLVEFCESVGKLVHLNYLEINFCKLLRELPKEVGCLKALKELIVRWTMLGPVVGLHLPHSIGNLQSLTRLEMESVGISELPLSIGELKNLESLCLSMCYELRKLPDSIGGLESLLELDLSYTKVAELPDQIGNLSKLKVIRIKHSEISKIPATIGMVEKLEEFDAENCTKLEGDIPRGIGSLYFLKILNLSYTRIRSVPTTIEQLSHLHDLHLEGCHELKRIPELPASLINLYVESRSLQMVPNLSNLTNLVNLMVSDCFEESLSNPWDADSIQTPNLEWVGRLSRLEKLKLVHKSIIGPPTELASLPGLEQLVLSCFDLQSLNQPLPPMLSVLKLINFNSMPQFSRHYDLKYLSSLELCKSGLTDIPLCPFGQLENLRELMVSDCEFLQRLSHLSDLKKLRVLRLLSCPRLVEIEGLVELESLESITIGQCSSLVRLPNLLKLKKLRIMEFRLCRSLVSLPFLSWVASEHCHLVVNGCHKLANHDGPFRRYKEKRQCPNPRSRL